MRHHQTLLRPYAVEMLEVRTLLSADLANDFPLGVYNATFSQGAGLDLSASSVQKDGKILLVGESQNFDPIRFDETRLLVIRLNPDGSPDASFGTNGRAPFTLGVEYDKVNGIATQTDGKIVIVGAAAQTGQYNQGAPAVARLNADGSIDQNFNKKWQASAAVLNDAGLAQADSVAFAPDGKAVIVFRTRGDTALVLRYLADGTLDKRFNASHEDLGNSGFVTQAPRRVIVLDDSRILVGGPNALTRLNSNGQIDRSFGANGTAAVFAERALFPLSDGHILVASGDTDFIVQRLTASGKLDAKFADHGTATIDFDEFDALGGIAVGTGGKIIAAGLTGDSQSNISRGAVTRLNANGTMDDTYGTHGKQLLSLPDYTFRSFLFPSIGGQFVFVVRDGGLDVNLIRLDGNGNVKKAFDGHSLAALIPTGQRGMIHAVTRDSSDHIFAAGSTNSLLGVNDFYLAKFNADGSLDGNFAGGAGWISADFGGTDDIAYAVALAPDGKIVLGGISDNHFAVARFTKDGKPDETFGTHGHATFNFHAIGIVRAIAVKSDRKIVFTGNDAGDHGALYLESGLTVARLNADGSPDQTFNKRGFLEGAGSIFHGVANAMVLQKSGRIVIAGQSGGAFMAAGYKADGSLDPHFGFNGIFRYLRQSTSGNIINRIALLGDDSILAAGVSGSRGVLLKLSSTGVLNTKVTGLIKGAIVPKSSGGYFDEINHLAIDDKGRFLISDVNSRFARLNPDLTLDKSFAPGGGRQLHLTDFFATDVSDLATLSNGRIVLSSFFADGRGPLSSFRPDAAPAAGVKLNASGTVQIVGRSGNDAIRIEVVGGNVRITFNGVQSRFPVGTVKRFAGELLDGNDRWEMIGNLPAAIVFGDGGNDAILTSGGDDVVVGGAGDDLIDGGGGHNSLGGAAGNDTLSYARSTENLNIDLTSHGDDAAFVTGDRDVVDALDGQFENATGGSGNDSIVSRSDGSGIFHGGPGNDEILGRGTLFGDAGDDMLSGFFVDSSYFGGDGNDTIEGSGTLDGGAGDDSLSNTGGRSMLFGQAGNDSLFSQNELRDTLDGGPGTDQAQYDVGLDVVKNVETNLDG
jgi:uncharacterized delta-60 repeat protein